MLDTSVGVAKIADTHGLVARPGTRIWASSEGLGWRSLFASAQRESPFEGDFRSVPDDLVVIHLSGPVSVSRLLDGKVETSVVPPGGAFIMPGGIEFGVRLGGQLDTVHFYVHRPVVDEIAAELVAGGGDIHLVPRLGVLDPLLEQIAVELRQQLQEADEATALYVDHLARAAAARLIRAHSTARPGRLPSPRRIGLTEAQLRRAAEFIEANIERDPNLRELAAAAGLSPVYFARQFRVSTGLAPHQYLLRARVERAQRLLASTGSPLAAIAVDCGFCHQEHMTRVFRKFSGTTPAAYRTAKRS